MTGWFGGKNRGKLLRGFRKPARRTIAGWTALGRGAQEDYSVTTETLSIGVQIPRDGDLANGVDRR